MRIAALLFMILVATVVSVAYADDLPAVDTISARVQRELSKRYLGARIELVSPIEWIQAGPGGDTPQGEIVAVNVSDENARGEVPFNVQSRDADGLHIAWGRIAFRAMQPARIAVRRILPGEPVQADTFVMQDVNVAFGPAREIRGLIVSPTAPLSRIETRQTILEGQPLLSSEVERIPDVRRGDPVRIQLVSGALTLSTLGIASEPGYLDDEIHVISQKTKRELIGKLLSGGIVEVKL